MDRKVQGERDGGVRQSTVTCLIWEDLSSIPAIGEEEESLMSITSPPVLAHYQTVTKIKLLGRYEQSVPTCCLADFQLRATQLQNLNHKNIGQSFAAEVAA